MDVQDKIKQLRLENNLTQIQLAEKVGVSKGTISKWESGDIENMRRDKIAKLAEALNATPSDIFGWAPEGEKETALIKESGASEIEAIYQSLPAAGKRQLENYAKFLQENEQK